MANTFGQDLFGRLPAEIQIMIASIVGPCWYLIVLVETRRLIELLRNDHRSQPGRLSLTQEVYITWAKYQGNSYISRISNAPFEGSGSPDQKCLETPARISRIILSVGHIGVRQVQFVDQDSNPSRDGSPWYEVLEVQEFHKEVYINFDVLQFISDSRMIHGS